MFSRSGRKTHSDRPGEDEAQEALRPESNGRSDQTPTVRLVSNGRSDQPQPPKLVSSGRSDQTPTVRLVSSGRSDQPQPPKLVSSGRSDQTPTVRLVSSGRRAYHSNRQTGVQREKGLSLQPPDVGRERRAYHSVHRPVLLAKGLITPHRQHPSWATCSVYPGLEGRTPRFLGRETLEKPETASIITATDTRWKGLA